MESVKPILVEGGFELPTLFKLNSRGKVQIWKVGVKGSIMTTSSYQEGGKVKLTTNEIEPKASRSLEEQALQEARAKYKKQVVGNGYSMQRPDVSGTGNATLNNEENKGPMLAETWAGGREDTDKGYAISEYPVMTQEKLDGVRCIARLVDGKIRLRSRKNTSYDHLSHLHNELTKLLQITSIALTESKLPLTTEEKATICKKIRLDGELFKPGLGFQKIVSLVRTVKKKKEGVENVPLCIYDLDVPILNNLQRYTLLVYMYNCYLATHGKPTVFDVVPAQMANSDEEVHAHETIYLAKKREGIIIRDPRALYENKRTRALLKHKPMFDEEAIIESLEEAKGAHAEAAIFVVRNANGKVYRATPVLDLGNLEERRLWVQRPELVVGKTVTIKYQCLTDDGIPRFGRAIAFRDYE